MVKHNEPAGNILDEAKRLVCNERTATHGETHPSFHAIAQMWQAYLRATHDAHPSDTINVTAEDVAQMMSLLKKIRHVFGDSTNPENFVDDAGFTSIAGMLAGAKVVTQEPEPDSSLKTRIAALSAVREAVDGPIR